jgi:hypothetical protein
MQTALQLGEALGELEAHNGKMRKDRNRLAPPV